MTKHSKNTEQSNSTKSVLPAVHYAPWGEWGGERVSCGRYYTTDVRHTGRLEKVTCKFCLKE